MLDHIGQIPAHAARSFQDKEALAFEGRSLDPTEERDLYQQIENHFARRPESSRRNCCRQETPRRNRQNRVSALTSLARAKTHLEH
jgi:hypothetical protein